jgi:hypothetical protein
LDCSLAIGSVQGPQNEELLACVYPATAERPTDDRCGVKGVECVAAKAFDADARVLCRVTAGFDRAGENHCRIAALQAKVIFYSTQSSTSQLVDDCVL